MQGDSASQFKLFRILWFPLSINAMLLGAASVVAFLVLTWLTCLTTGDSGATMAAARAFRPSVITLVKEGSWPGFATEEKDGRFVHHLLAKEKVEDEDRTRARAEEAMLGALFRPYATERLAAIKGEGEALEKERAAVSRDLERSLPRYRIVFLVQILGAFFLLCTFGVAICRLLALRIARDEYCPMATAMSYAWKVKLTGLLYPLAVVLPLLLLGICNQVAGVVVSIPFIGGIFGVILYPLVVITSIVIALCLLVGVFCVGLLPAAIATERKGTYDSLGKVFNYVFARPIPVILHGASVLLFLTVLSWLFLEHRLMERVLAASMTPFWSSADTKAMLLGQTEGLSGWRWFYGWLFQAFLALYALLLRGTFISLVLGAFTALFLVLRQDVDGVSTSEVAREPKAVVAVPPPAPPPAAAAPVTPPPAPGA